MRFNNHTCTHTLTRTVTCPCRSCACGCGARTRSIRSWRGGHPSRSRSARCKETTSLYRNFIARTLHQKVRVFVRIRKKIRVNVATARLGNRVEKFTCRNRKRSDLNPKRAVSLSNERQLSVQCSGSIGITETKSKRGDHSSSIKQSQYLTEMRRCHNHTYKRTRIRTRTHSHTRTHT